MKMSAVHVSSEIRIARKRMRERRYWYFSNASCALAPWPKQEKIGLKGLRKSLVLMQRNSPRSTPISPPESMGWWTVC